MAKFKQISLLYLLSWLFLSTTALSEMPLDKWEDWILEKHPEHNCAYYGQKLSKRLCSWPGPLKLDVSKKGADFTQRWKVEGDSWLVLPGNPKYWPTSVSINNSPAIVVNRRGTPMLRVEPGDHLVSGKFDWNVMPQRLPIPKTTGILDLSVNGTGIENPALDKSGMLWLQKDNSNEVGESDGAKVEVFRSLEDSVPRKLTTVVKLSISGKARELETGLLLLPDMITERFESELPARIEEDGTLRMQVRSGEWTIYHVARVIGDANEFKSSKRDEFWPEQEVWGYVSEPTIRRAKVSGVQLIDGGQLDLPQQLDDQPLYMMTPQKVMKLEEQYRGDSEPQANQLKLERTVWLDFDGDGATIKDNISGTMYQDWRLEVQPLLVLGSAEVDEQPQLITRLTPDSGAGLEIRNSYVSVNAVSHVDKTEDINATGWKADFDTVSSVLQVPPGWRVWHIGGPDNVQNSWLSKWDLWDIFLCLIIVGGIFQTMGWKWAATAFMVGALTFHEKQSIFVLIAPFIILLPLMKVLPKNRFKKWVASLCYLTLFIVAFNTLQFAVQQIRVAMYPQLEFSRAIQASTSKIKMRNQESLQEVPLSVSSSSNDMMIEEVVVTASKRQSSYRDYDFESRPRIDSQAKVQTGPGIPNWSWKRIKVSWSGPVKANETIDLYLTGPTITRILNVVEVILSIILVVGIAMVTYRTNKLSISEKMSSSGTVVGALLAVIVCLSSYTPPSTAEDYPPKYLLEEYEKRLLKAPECSPYCISINDVQVQLTNDLLNIEQRITTDAKMAVALPTSKQWQPRSITINGKVQQNISRNNGILFVSLPAGAHQIVMEGPLSRSEVNLEFSEKVHNITAKANGWDVLGIVDRGLPGKTLSLERREKTVSTDTLLADPPEPFAIITRTLVLDVDWFIDTTIERVAPVEGPISLDVPLIEGESILTDGVVVEKNLVKVSIGARQEEFSWRSQLDPRSEVKLTHPEVNTWSERWVVLASPRWHLNTSGLPPLKLVDLGEPNNIWLPWPGETLTVNPIRPLSVDGATTTVESAQVIVRPGRRSISSEFFLSVKSSTGGDYVIGLPPESSIKSFVVNAESFSPQSNKGQIVASLKPGDNSINIQWDVDGGITSILNSPEIKLSTPANNVTTKIELPRDRWPLLVWGPSIGPAMLYWGVLCVIVAVSIGLGYLTKRAGLSIPLKSWHWILLGVGMSTINTVGSIFVVGWFFGLEARKRIEMPKTRFNYNLIQFGLIALTGLALISLLGTIPLSLLSSPDMMVTGNGSSNYFMAWYADHATELLPVASVVSVSLWVYRITMLLWSIWLVFALLKWAGWGWNSFSSGELWMPKLDDTLKKENESGEQEDSLETKG